MENVKNSYECMFITSLANGEDAAKAVVNKFTGLISANAEVIKIDEWGKRRFAYLIDDMNEGYYTVATFQCDGAFPAELQRLMNIDESVLRTMVIKLEYDPTTVQVEEAPVAEEAATVEEATTEEAPAADAE